MTKIPKRVAILTGRFPDCFQTFVADHIANLIQAGIEVKIYSRRKPDWATNLKVVNDLNLQQHTTCLAINGNTLNRIISTCWSAFKFLFSPQIKVLVKKTGPKANFFEWVKIYRHLCIIKKGGPFDIIHCHFGPHGSFLTKMIPLGFIHTSVTTFHGYDVNTISTETGRQMYKFLFQQGAAFTANSNFTQNKLITLGCPRERIYIWPMGVDINKFIFSPRRLSTTESIRLVTVARLVPPKGVDLILDAMVKLKTTRQVELTVVGGGSKEMQDLLDQQVKKLGLTNSVKFAGPQSPEQVVGHLQNSHLFILASRQGPEGSVETQGIVLLEAQACGLPVVTTRLGGIPDSVLEGESAILVEPDNSSDLAEAIDLLITKADDWPEMGACGRRHVENKFSIEATTKIVLDVYRDITNRVSQGQCQE